MRVGGDASELDQEAEACGRRREREQDLLARFVEPAVAAQELAEPEPRHDLGLIVVAATRTGGHGAQARERGAIRKLGVFLATETLRDLAAAGPGERRRRLLARGALEADARGVVVAFAEERAAEQGLRVHFVGRRRHRLAQLAHGSVEAAGAQVRGAEATVGLGAHVGIARPRVERAAIGFGGLFGGAGSERQLAEREPGLDEARPLAGARVERERAFFVAATLAHDAEQVGGARVIGADGERGRELAFGAVEIAGGQVGLAELDVGANVVGDDQLAQLIGEAVEAVEQAHG